MKIEIGENLVYSYLRHIEGCRIVQTNWKTSGRWQLTEFETEQSIKLLNEIRKLQNFAHLFSNVKFEQIMKQAEIDVVGINTIESSVFGVEIAFHSADVNYGRGDENVAKIMEKLLRMIFIMQSYFKDFSKFNAYFVAPKASDRTMTRVNELIKELEDFIKDDSLKIRFISEEDFYGQLLTPLIAEDFKEHDTNELFSRAIKLLKLGKYKIVPEGTETKTTEHSQGVKADSQKRTVDGMKIGQFVQSKMKEIHEKGLLSTDKVENLLDKDYSKTVFNQNFPVLKRSSEDTKDENGRNRYYTGETYFGDYHLTSQWFERHWDPFLSWLSRVNAGHKIYS